MGIVWHESSEHPQSDRCHEYPGRLVVGRISDSAVGKRWLLLLHISSRSNNMAISFDEFMDVCLFAMVLVFPGRFTTVATAMIGDIFGHIVSEE